MSCGFSLSRTKERGGTNSTLLRPPKILYGSPCNTNSQEISPINMGIMFFNSCFIENVSLAKKESHFEY